MPESTCWNRGLGVLVILVCVAFILTLPVGNMLDAQVRYEDMQRVLAGETTVQKFSMVGPLGATPLFYLGKLCGDPKTWVWCYNRILILVACAVLAWGFRPVQTGAERLRFTVALLLASMMPHNLEHFSGEVFSCVVTAVGLSAVVVRRAWWGMPLAILGAVNLPATMPALGLASCVLVVRSGRLRLLLTAPTAFSLWLLENYLRRGDPWNTGYDGEHGLKTILPYSGRPEFSYPFFLGLLSILFSFGKGLVFFIPALFLTFPRDISQPNDTENDLMWVYRVWLAYVVGLVVVYSKWWAWYGGWCWGPRFFLFGSFVASLVIARRVALAERLSTAANVLMLAILALSSWVAINGVVYDQLGLHRFLDDELNFEHLVWYVPECSALWWPLVTQDPQPLTGLDHARFAAVALGFVYLASPVFVVVVRRFPGHLRAGWEQVRGLWSRTRI